MNEDKKVSVILCFYNEEKYLAKSIDSVLTQTYSNFELILVNDGSTDHSEEIVKNYHDNRIVYKTYEGNKHLAYARNRGLELATGDYIAFFDGDDIMVSNKLEKQVSYLNEHKDIMIVSGGFSYMDSEGNVEKKIIEPRYLDDEHIRAFFLFGNCIANGATMFRREVIDKYHLYLDESNSASEDWRYWISVLPYGKFANMNECFYYYRVNHGSKAKSIMKKDEQEYYNKVNEILEVAWKTRGFLLNTEDISFIHKFLCELVRIWKPKDIVCGINLYKKIKRQISNLSLKEGNVILQLFRQCWLQEYHVYWGVKKVIGMFRGDQK